MTKMQNHIDRRPFRSQADRAREVALETRYQQLAIPAVVAAVQQVGGMRESDPSKSQMG